MKESRDRGVFFTNFVYFGPKGLRIRRERFKKVGFKFFKVGNNFITSTMVKG